MVSPTVGAKDLLVAAGVGVFSPTPVGSSYLIVISRLKDAPDRQIVLYDTGGQEPNPQWLVNYPTIQATIRGASDDYVNTYARAQQVFDVLVGLPSQDLNGDRWVSVTSLGGINNLGYDDKDRPRFTINLRLIIEPATNALTHRESL